MKIKKVKLIAGITGSVLILCSVLALCISSTYKKSPVIQDVTFAAGNGTPDNPFTISSVEQLAGINKNLSASYILTKDLDLSSYKNFVCIGEYVQNKDSPEGEDPFPEYAFTGTFDGNGHTIKNLKTKQFIKMGTGLFNCLAGATVKNLTVENADVKGAFLTSVIAGYSFESTIDNVTVKNSKVSSSMIMAGGIVGGSSLGTITNCNAENVKSSVGSMGLAGTLGGGVSHPEQFFNNHSKGGTVSAKLGKKGYCIGGLTGCINSPASDIKNCSAEDIIIQITGNGQLAGGLTGGTGTLAKNADYITTFENCSANNIKINLKGNTEYVGMLLGGGMADEDTNERQTEIVKNCTTINVSILAPNKSDLVSTLVGLQETAIVE